MPPLRLSSPPRLRGAVLLALVAAAALLRVLPHPPNFTPVGAMALFAGAHFASRWTAVLAPLGSMFASDLLLQALHGHGFGAMTIVIYGCIAGTTLLGMLLRHRCTPQRIAGLSLAAAFLFFGVTNLAVWIGSGLYPRDAAGLAACFAAAVPFFGNTLAGHAVFGIALFGGFQLLQRRIPAIAAKTVAA